MDAATGQAIKDSALGLLGLPVVEHAVVEHPQDSFKVVANFLTTREPDEAMQASIGRVLAERARPVMVKEAGDRTPAGILRAEVDGSDEATCEDLEGKSASAFERGERCYKLVLEVATEDAL